MWPRVPTSYGLKAIETGYGGVRLRQATVEGALSFSCQKRASIEVLKTKRLNFDHRSEISTNHCKT